jgi:hypothetical protein
MNVSVDETGQKRQAGEINDFHVGWWNDVRPRSDNRVAGDEHKAGCDVQTGCHIEQAVGTEESGLLRVSRGDEREKGQSQPERNYESPGP